MIDAEIREIFFLSSNRQKFASLEEKDKFFSTWTSYYFKYCPDLIFTEVEDQQVQGYLMGCADSGGALEFYRERLPSYACFADLFARFPAHLHVNVHPRARGRGVGGLLIERFVNELKKRNIHGVHIVTSPDSANCEFYRRHQFLHEQTRSFKQHELHFMGRSL